jgi:hypothetical protein
MTFNVIPINISFPWQTSRLALSGVTYTIRFRYNNRSTRWEMDIADGSNNDILDGIVLLINEDLTYQYKTALANLPAGTFFVLDNTNQNTQPTQFSFGTTHSLIYADPTQ